MTLPNFLIIGAAKAATSSLYHYLRQHPQIYMSPQKETDFWGFGQENVRCYYPVKRNKRVITSQLAYEALFQNATNERAVGEASPIYLMWPHSAQCIQASLPNAKLIAILRQPVDRAYSHFLMNLRNGVEPLSDFMAAWQAEANRIQHNWMPSFYYQQQGYYHTQLARYFDRFPKTQIRVYLYEDLSTAPLAMLRDIYHFLELDEDFAADISERRNVAQLPRSRFVYQFLRQPSLLKQLVRLFTPVALRTRLVAYIMKFNRRAPPKLAPELRSQLTEGYRADILHLQTLINRDLSHWLA